MDSGILFSIFIFLLSACVIVPLARRFRLGAVLGYFLAGILIGPYGLSLITNSEQIVHIAEFGVVMMLFLIGLELEPPVLWRMRRSILGLGGLQVVLTSMVFCAIGIMCGFDWRISLAVGMALALSSTALVLQMLQEENLDQTLMGEKSFAVLLFQDIAVIPILVVMPLLAVSGHASDAHAINNIASLPGWVQTLIVASVIAMLVVTGRYLSRYMFYYVAKTNMREVFTAMSLALVVGVTLLMQLVGVSPALGAFVAGVVLSTSEYKNTLETDIEPFKGLLLGLFFISVGLGINFSLLSGNPFQVLGAVATIIIVKAAILYALGRYFGLDPQQNAGFAIALSQGGEFAFVLFQFAGGLNILSADQSAFLTLVVALSIAITPFLMLAYGRYIVPRFMSVLPERPFDVIDTQNTVIIAGYGRYGQVVGRFLNSLNADITILEKDPEQIEALRKYGVKAYFGDASRIDLLKSAGADKAAILVVAVDDPDICLQIVRRAKEHFPLLRIFARAHNRRHAYELDRLGVAYFRRELFDSSLGMAQEIMIALGHDTEDIRIKAEFFRRHDEESLRKSFDFFDSEPELVNFARLQREELDRILQSDTPFVPPSEKTHG